MHIKLLSGIVISLTLGFNLPLQAQEWKPSKTSDGWSVLTEYLVESDGSRSLGVIENFNTERDTGSKILYFDPDNGDNATAEVYWWNGTNIIDSEGNTQNADGITYGTNPLEPNLDAIAPFAAVIGMRGNADGDLRLRTHHRYQYLVAGYPDWFLFRRGAEHTIFDGALAGGRSGKEPMVVAAYGPKADGRAIFNPQTTTVVYDGNERGTSSNPLTPHTHGDDTIYFHMVYAGLELHHRIGNLGTHTALSPSGGPVTLHVEDCKLIAASMVYMARESYIYRTISAYTYNPESHNQGYFNSGFKAAVEFEESIFYKNGYKNDPRTHADPRRDIFSRNIYQGGGAQMGHIYRGIISADGASGGPQMRLGGTCENSLIIEGYFYSSTSSNQTVNEWLPGQSGMSALVRNNVQFVYRYPNATDPDTYDNSDNRAQPGWGYTLQGASFGSIIENNIISGSMLFDNANTDNFPAQTGLSLNTNPYTYQDSITYSLKGNIVRNNIVYQTKAGLKFEGDWSVASGNVVKENVFVSQDPISERSFTNPGPNTLSVSGNRFYHQEADLGSGNYLDASNQSLTYEDAVTAEGWPDPDRTMRRYVTEVCGLTLLDWSDDPWLPESEITPRRNAGEEYDPFGIKTFMAVATNMRHGGVSAIPTSGKPSWEGDYNWNSNFTGLAVVNWVREGFGLEQIPFNYNHDYESFMINYPNPFERTTTISFAVPTNGRYTVKIFDLSGRLVDVLMDEEIVADRYTLEWENNTVKHGVYICQLASKKKVLEHHKIVKLR